MRRHIETVALGAEAARAAEHDRAVACSTAHHPERQSARNREEARELVGTAFGVAVARRHDDV